jgi:outer membrane protein, heavy metal efflux system
MHVLVTAVVAARMGRPLRAQNAPPIDSLTIDQAISEALGKNLGLLAERYNLTIADARIITAHLRPNPVLTLDADTLDLLGTGFNTQTNNGGPVSYAIRTDYLLERCAGSSWTCRMHSSICSPPRTA